MPAHGELIGPDRADGLSPVGVREDSVVVDFGVDPAEHDRLREDIEQSRQRIEELQNAYDREAADGKRLRAEGQTLRDRIEELRKAIQDRQEAVEAQERIADELRNETRQARDDLAAVRVQIGEMTENLAARDRHIARTHEDIGKLKDDIEELEKQLADVSRTKDEGWRKLNEQLSEIDNLREVVNEQERMLEERRVGLVSQEEMINQLRREKEAMLKEKAQLKAERDELRADSGRSSAQISAIDEENKRLAKMLAEIQGRAVSGHPVDASDHAARAAEEIKSLRVELRTVESDRDRLQEMYERAETEVDRLQQAVARLEVESRDWHDKSNRAASNKSVADEALGKAEAARHKAQEEAIAAARQRDEAVTGADQARRELDRARRRIDELESSRGDPTASGGGGMDGARARDEQQLIDAQVRISELEEALSALRRQARSFVLPDGEEATAVVAAAGPDKLGERALTVHDSINDVLSELRSNILLIQGEFADLAKEHSGHSARIIRETIEALVGNAEDAKGALRSLRELVEFDA
jgi:chromosome segregation ATPase